MKKGFAEKVLHALHLDFSSQAGREVDAKEGRAARKTATRFSRGNTNVQEGAFLTSNELEEERRAAKKLDLTG